MVSHFQIFSDKRSRGVGQLIILAGKEGEGGLQTPIFD